MTEPTELPFEVELFLGRGLVVPFKLYPDRLLSSRDPRIAAIAAPGDRDAARQAGVAVAENAVTRNVEVPLHVEDHDSYWIIPVATVQAVRFRDPTLPGKEEPFEEPPQAVLRLRSEPSRRQGRGTGAVSEAGTGENCLPR